MDKPAGPLEDGGQRYLAHPRDQRRGVALCLSGGGYRAALFHLGALRRLNELGVLSQVDTWSTVSGGSILAAFLVDRVERWPAPGEQIDDFDGLIAKPFRDFTSKNIRTLPFLRRLLPWNWLRSSTAVEALAARYRRDVTRMQLRELPQRPRFVLCATDMSYGTNWILERERMGDYQVGYASPPPDWPLARAVAASSCFPPAFDPLPVREDPSLFNDGKAKGRDRDEAVSKLGLSDGGVYDNMGLEPVWKDHAVLLVSDGGATFDFGPDKGLLWRLKRYTSIVSRQASSVRKRWLIASFLRGELMGAFWGIGSFARNYGDYEGYPEELVDKIISEVRTDLDAFSTAEKSVLENHGYLMATAAIDKHAPHLVTAPSPIRVPHPEWLDPERVRTSLADSHRTRLPFGRL